MNANCILDISRWYQWYHTKEKHVTVTQIYPWRIFFHVSTGLLGSRRSSSAAITWRCFSGFRLQTGGAVEVFLGILGNFRQVDASYFCYPPGTAGRSRSSEFIRINQISSSIIKSLVSHWIPLLVSLLFASPTQLLISGRTSCTSMALQSSKAPHSCGAADIQGESQLSDTV